MNTRIVVSADRSVRPGTLLPGLVLLGILAATVEAAPPNDSEIGTPTTVPSDAETPTDNPTTPNTDQDGFPVIDSGTTDPFDRLQDSDNPADSARYKYSVRYNDGNRRKLETVNAASEPLAYRKVREKHPDADSILLIEVRRDGERVDRSRHEGNSGRTIVNPLSGRHTTTRKTYSLLGATPEIPDSPFAKLIDQMHTQNIQNILRGRTFQETNMRIRQSLIELQQRRLAAARARQQASSRGSGSSGNSGAKTPFSKGNTHRRRRNRLGNRVRPGRQDGSGASGSTGGGKTQPGEGDAGIGLGSGIPVTPKF